MEFAIGWITGFLIGTFLTLEYMTYNGRITNIKKERLKHDRTQENNDKTVKKSS